MTIDQAVERVQFAYPQIYFACHARHERTRSTARELSARDSQILDRRRAIDGLALFADACRKRP